MTTTNTLPTLQDDPALILETNMILYRIAALQHREASLRRRYESDVAIAKGRLDPELKEISYRLNLLHPQVIPWAKLEIEATPKKTKTAKLPGVRMSFRAAKDKVEVDNLRVKVALNDTEKVNALKELGLIRTKVELNKTALNDFIEKNGGVPQELAGMVTVDDSREDAFSITFEDIDAFLESLLGLTIPPDPTEQEYLDYKDRYLTEGGGK